MVKLFNNVYMDDLNVDHLIIRSGQTGIIPHVYQTQNSTVNLNDDISDVYIVDEFSVIPQSQNLEPTVVNNKYYQNTKENKLYKGVDGVWVEVTHAVGDRYFLFKDTANTTGSIYQINPKMNNALATKIGIENTSKTIILHNLDKKAYRLSVAADDDEDFDAVPTAISEELTSGDFLGVKSTAGSYNDVTLFRYADNKFELITIEFKKYDDIKLINTVSVPAYLANDPVPTNLDLNGSQVLTVSMININIDSNLEGQVKIADKTGSTDKDTGALVVEGGVGIEENLNVGGNTKITGTIDVDNTINGIYIVKPDPVNNNTDLNTGQNNTDVKMSVTKRILDQYREYVVTVTCVGLKVGKTNGKIAGFTATAEGPPQVLAPAELLKLPENFIPDTISIECKTALSGGGLANDVTGQLFLSNVSQGQDQTPNNPINIGGTAYNLFAASDKSIGYVPDNGRINQRFVFLTTTSATNNVVECTGGTLEIIITGKQL